MVDIEQLLISAQDLLQQETPAPAEIRKVMIDLDDAIHSAEFSELENEQRARLQSLYQDLRSHLREQERPSGPNTADAVIGYEDVPSAGPLAVSAGEREHNPYAAQQMEEAEKLFYGGRYAEAIKLYDQVLQIEPDWERARQHRNESESYLRTGHIPSVALPPEAATAFGKAQSAARLGRYQDAMALLNRAQANLRELGIQRWQEGQEFEQKLQQNIDAESVYNEGLYLFRQGQVDEGIDRVETAARATGLPRYNDRLQEMRKVKETLRAISEALNTPTPDAKAVAQSKTDLDALLLEYGENPTLTRLRTRLAAAIPLLSEPMKEQADDLINQSERSQTLEGMEAKARQARQVIDQVRKLGYSDENLERRQAEVEKLLRTVDRYRDQLTQAGTVFNTNRSWPAAAARLSQEVRARFPNDPGVIELNRLLARYHAILTGAKVAVGGVILLIVGFFLSIAFGQARSFVLALTPSPTPTATFTYTPTATETPLPTITHTPGPTLTPSLTPTPLAGGVSRLVWARNGCYENFSAIGRIPAGATVRFLPSDRRFDNLGRECLLVEYDGKEGAVIGWILIADLGPAPTATPNR